MAATDLFRRAPPAPAGALPQTPALLRDGGNPNGERGRGRGISSPGCSSMPPNPRPGQGRLRRRGRGRKRPPCPVRGTGGTTRGWPDEEMPNPSGNRPAGPPEDEHVSPMMNRRSIKQGRKIIYLVEQGRHELP